LARTAIAAVSLIEQCPLTGSLDGFAQVRSRTAPIP